jgi:hypothetical protein
MWPDDVRLTRRREPHGINEDLPRSIWIITGWREFSEEVLQLGESQG